MRHHKWEFISYTSGTHIVRKNINTPYFYVYGDNRRLVCLELCDFLNHGVIPEWLNKLKRESSVRATGTDNIDIEAILLTSNIDNFPIPDTSEFGMDLLFQEDK